MNQRDQISRSESLRLERCAQAAHHVGLVLFDGCCLPNASVISEAFRLANEFETSTSGQPAYRLSLLSSTGGNIATSSAISIWTSRLDGYSPRDFDTIFIACDESEATARRDLHLLSWLSGPGRVAFDGQRHTEGIALDLVTMGRPIVPVYWFKDAPIAALSGIQTPADLALAKIELDLGAHVARRVARELQPHLSDYAGPGADDLNVTTTIDKIHESARWIRENFGEAISIADAAEVAAMSNRNYLRRFRSEFGVTPQQYLMDTRFKFICRLLIESDLPVEKIARRCGMGNGDRLGRHFRIRYGMSPTQYRAKGRTRPQNRSFVSATAQA
jgi:transcriptional regulator GlxA family with amidase domain